MPLEKHLPDKQMSSVIYCVRRTDPERIKQLDRALGIELARLGVKPDPSFAANKPHTGSENFDTGSLIDWAQRINPADKQAVAQLLCIHATVRARL